MGVGSGYVILKDKNQSIAAGPIELAHIGALQAGLDHRHIASASVEIAIGAINIGHAIRSNVRAWMNGEPAGGCAATDARIDARHDGGTFRMRKGIGMVLKHRSAVQRIDGDIHRKEGLFPIKAIHRRIADFRHIGA